VSDTPLPERDASTFAMQRTAISLYTGVGGLDFGLEAAGFETRVAVEMDRVSCETIRLNRGWPVLQGDIHEISSKSILTRAELKPSEADVLIGGPPCQPFSKSGYWVNGDAGRLGDARASTLGAYLRVLRDARPRAFLLENVPGLVFRDKDEGLKFLLDGIEAINRSLNTGYTVHWKVLNAAHFGVPQTRERVFLVGSRDGLPFTFPAATHCAPEEKDRVGAGLEPFRTAWDAIGDLPANPNEAGLVVGGKWGDLLPTIPEGENYLWHTPRGSGKPLFGWRTRYWSFLLKLKKTLPSWTIQAQPGSAIGPFHWKNRRLSVREMCRLQTLPDGLSFECGRGDVQRMIGNAVPSLLTEILGREIRRQLLGDPRSRTGLKLIPPARTPVPPAERVRPMPEKYYQYMSDHPDHPGEGRGRAALEWSRGRAA
jgi:DNA (cytosine-5)-methyltransferase 1